MISPAKQKRLPLHGWVALDKPRGLTSTQALGRVRRLLNGDKVGHAGTLDPLATGVLPLAFGEATKLVPHVMDGDKEYEFVIRWGEARDTEDAEGKVTATSDARPTPDAIRAAFGQFTGPIQQTPPAFSAIKIDGERAYDIARAGGTPDVKPRPVTIHTIELVDIRDADHAGLRVSCGKGMYVRSLARDLAVALGTVGYIKKLRRTRSGPFTLPQAISLENLEDLSNKGGALTALLPLQAALDDIPVLNLSESEAQRLRTGQSILIRPGFEHLLSAPSIFAECHGVPVALVEAKAGAFRVVRGFHF